jgi:hypothetical protein
MAQDGQKMFALLTLETSELTVEFAINEDGANAMAGNLQQFLRHGAVEGRQAELIGG